MAPRKLTTASLALLACLIAVAPARADIAPRWSDAELADFSAVVVTGRVSHLASAFDPVGGGIYTYVTVDVTEVLKGWVPESQIIVKQAGGVVDGIGMRVGGQAQFLLGEEVLLFLEVRPRDSTLYTTALWQGKWTIATGADGARVATRRDPSAEPAPALEVRNLAGMQNALRERAGAASRQPSDLFIRVAPAEAPLGSSTQPFVLLDTPARWNSTPVTVDIQSGGQPGLAGGGGTQMTNALSQWNAAGANFSWTLRSTSAASRCGSPFASSGIMTVVFNDPCGEISNSGGTLAVATTWFTTGSTTTVNGTAFERMLEVIIITNDSSTATPFLTNANCFQHVFLHEAGHALGLGHTAVEAAVMFATVSFSGCSGAAPVLNADDNSGIQFIYPGGSGTVTPPAAPTNVQVQVAGTQSLTVSWTPAANDLAGPASPATSFRLDFRATINSAVLATVSASSSPHTIAIPAGTSGTFGVQVTGINSAGAGTASAFTTFTIGTAGPGPCSSAPPTPTGLAISVNASKVATVTWNASTGATSYILQAGSAQGGTNLFNASVGANTSVVSGTLSSGFMAFVRVIAVNDCGQSAASSDVSFTVPDQGPKGLSTGLSFRPGR